jgi:glutamine synthetase
VTTDLEAFVDRPGREKAIAEVRKQIDAEGVTYMYYQFVSVTGRIMGKGIPAKHWESLARNGFQLVYGSTANLFVDRDGNYIGYGPEARELVGLPDVETFCVLPWDRKTARVFCTLFRGREEEVDGGAFLTSDCRGNLKRIHDEFTAETGLHLRAGTEPEMMWLKTNPDGTPTVEGKTKPYCYHIDQFSELQPIIHKVMEYGEAMGLDMIQGDHEDAPGQLELNFNFDRAELTADRLTTYRQICRQVGREMNAFACFMPKPFMGVSANGCHHNISLWQGDENMFMPDGEDPRVPGKIGLHAIGGVLEHLRALTCITSPTVNSYRRFWDAGFWAPIFADWGFQNRTTALRISAPGATVPFGRFLREPIPVVRGVVDGHEGRPGSNLDPGPRRAQHLRGDQEGKEVVRVPEPSVSPRRARGRRDRPIGVARRHVPGLHALQARRVDPLHRDGERLGYRRVPRHPSVDRKEHETPHVRDRGHHPPGRNADVGSEMTRMLQAMKHRGRTRPDSRCSVRRATSW